MHRCWNTKSRLAVFLGLLAAGSFASAQEDDELPDYRPGLAATYQAATGEKCRRTDEAIRFAWPDGVCDPRLPPGKFAAHWRGRLFSIEPGDYQLHVYSAGEVELVLNGQSLLTARSGKPAWHSAKLVKLTYGHHPLEIRYHSAGPASQLALFWQGPRFQLEPLPAWHLFHDPPDSTDDAFAQGQRLVRALRCGACHEVPGEADSLPAPSLAHLHGNVQRDWLVQWLAASPHSELAESFPARRMPAFSLDRPQAEAIADYLLSSKAAAPATGDAQADGSGDAARGEQIFATTGCLACHQVGPLGKATLFGGGELSHVAAKRPADFFARWLAEPEKINPAHRMPVFRLSEEERADLSAWLATLGRPSADNRPGAANGTNHANRGRELVAALRCGACHELPGAAIERPKRLARLNATSDWSRSCLTSGRRPQSQPAFALPESHAAAIRTYIAQVNPTSAQRSIADGHFVLEERNCTACHARGPEGGIASVLPAVVERFPALAQELPLLTAPSLLGVGDKLHEKALADAISTRDGPRRPWLTIRMPRFNLAETEQQALIEHFIQHDRIPDNPPARATSSLPAKKALAAAGARLVTSDGFGCTSCHKIGEWTPKKVALNARGTELSVLGERIRKPWFDRWVRNPARIVPRMEMPSIVAPARKILDENLDHQLAAVWDVLNRPGFTPPAPSAIRVVNTTNLPGANEPAQVLTDVLEAEKHVFIRPLLVALPNRHNVLIDQQTNTLAGWWTGDAALQRTRGKSWYWEPMGTPFWPLEEPRGTDLVVRLGQRVLRPQPRGQHAAVFDELEHVPGGVRFTQRVRFGDSKGAIEVRIAQTLTAYWPDAAGAASGFERTLSIVGLPSGAIAELNPLPGRKLHWSPDGLCATATDVSEPCRVEVRTLPGKTETASDGQVVFLLAASGDNPIVCELLYRSDRPVDQAIRLPQPPSIPSAPLSVAPGYEALRLPLPEEEMPTALAWREDGTLIVASLKGRVLLARDTDGDGLEDSMAPFSDELAAPYGLAAYNGAIDVITKYALLRLSDENADGRADRTQVVASGWGHTADYHDWAVGLPRDAEGNYYVALPCQQDERSPAAAYLRGRGLKLTPRKPTPDNPHLYAVEVYCEGLRFPMGLALSRTGQLFATDNQGNYNPFNELNHLLPGRHYGFINKLEFQPGVRPPLESPAIEIPHPWTRSVNGICFLDTPPELRARLGRDVFGPHEGHLVGCEYDTRQLVRMSLEQVGGVWQGAAYPFTVPVEEGQEPLQGPVCCAVSPTGDLYVGSMRDSGWGAGANVGSIARLRPTGTLPSGIASVGVTAKGFVVHFTRPVAARLAQQPSSYAVSSYRRISTPAYGGPDVDRKAHAVREVRLSSDRLQAELVLDELREGFVYELRLKNLTGSDEVFHPAEAHYTLRAVPR